MRSLAHAAGALLLVTALAVSAAEVAPDALVKSNVDEVLSVIKQNKDRRTLNDLAEKRVLPHFDFQTMTQGSIRHSTSDSSAMINTGCLARPAKYENLTNAARIGRWTTSA